MWKVAFLSEYGAADPGDINIHWKQIYMWALEYSAVVRMTPDLGLQAPSFWAHPMGIFSYIFYSSSTLINKNSHHKLFVNEIMNEKLAVVKL